MKRGVHYYSFKKCLMALKYIRPVRVLNGSFGPYFRQKKLIPYRFGQRRIFSLERSRVKRKS